MIRIFASLILLLMLSGCNGAQTADAPTLINEMKTRIKPDKPYPLPKTATHLTYVEIPRKPFREKTPKNVNMTNKGPLEAFSIDSLRLVGIITDNGQSIALILAPDKVVYSAKKDDIIGDSQGHIIEMGDNSLTIREQPNGTTSSTTLRTMTMQGKDAT